MDTNLKFFIIHNFAILETLNVWWDIFKFSSIKYFSSFISLILSLKDYFRRPIILSTFIIINLFSWFDEKLKNLS